MSSIIKDGDTFHGICVFGRGVFTYDEGEYGRRTYVGQIRDGHACGLGVTTYSDGNKVYAEHGPDGECDGRSLWRFAGGNTGYELHERGESKYYAHVHADGACMYSDRACAPSRGTPDDPRFLALIAQVAPVEVRPAAPAPATRTPLAPMQSSDGSAGSFCPRQALAAAVATEVHPIPHAFGGGCAT